MKDQTWRGRLLLVSAFVVLATTLVRPSVAQAQETDIVVDGSRATVTVVAAAPITRGAGAPGATPYWPYTCHWDTPFANTDVIIAPTDSPLPGHRYWLRCLADDASGLDDIGQFVVYDPQDPVPGFDAVTSIEIRDFARDFVEPDPLFVGISPQDVQITGVETWFWPDGSIDRIQASATANGLTVTVQARYRGTTFDVGEADTDPVVCTEQVVWAAGLDTTPCAHTYLTQAAGRTIDAKSTWDFVWWDNAAQPIPALYDTIAPNQLLDVDVVDLEAVISRGG